jgi:antitoxin VapB
MHKEGDKLVIAPVNRKSFIELLDSWEPMDEEFPPIEELPYEDVEI